MRDNLANILADPESLEDIGTLRVDFNDVETDLSDAFVQYEIFPNGVLILGRRRVIWGQFDLVSPLNLVLPLSTRHVIAGSDKINYAIPQDGASLDFYLGERLRVNLHYFYRTRIDPLLHKAVETSSDLIYDIADNGFSILSARSASSGDVESHHQYALRLLYYGDWGTVGFTYYDGRIGFNYNGQGNVERVQHDELTFYNVDRNIDLPQVQQWAVEASVPLSHWIVKAEALYQETSLSFPAFSYSSDNPFLPVLWGEERLRLYVNYLDEILRNNGGRLAVDIRQFYIGVGVDARLPNWDINCILAFSFITLGDEGRRLLRYAHDVFDSDKGRLDVFPIVHIGYRFGEDDRYHVGVAGGMVGLATGAMAYMQVRLGDNWFFSVNGQSLRYVLDDFISDVSSQSQALVGGYYQRSEERDYSGQLSFVYRF